MVGHDRTVSERLADGAPGVLGLVLIALGGLVVWDGGSLHGLVFQLGASLVGTGVALVAYWAFTR